MYVCSRAYVTARSEGGVGGGGVGGHRSIVEIILDHILHIKDSTIICMPVLSIDKLYVV
jgi:hypothetical protein